MFEKRDLVQCVYRSRRQFEQHAVLMLETGYAIHAVNGLCPRATVDRASVRAFLACDLDRIYGAHSPQAGAYSVTYRLAAQAVPA